MNIFLPGDVIKAVHGEGMGIITELSVLKDGFGLSWEKFIQLPSEERDKYHIAYSLISLFGQKMPFFAWWRHDELTLVARGQNWDLLPKELIDIQ
jgi:hypothetical protein